MRALARLFLDICALFKTLLLATAHTLERIYDIALSKSFFITRAERILERSVSAERVCVFSKLVLHSIKLSAPSSLCAHSKAIFHMQAVADNYQHRLISTHLSIISTLRTGTGIAMHYVVLLLVVENHLYLDIFTPSLFIMRYAVNCLLNLIIFSK